MLAAPAAPNSIYLHGFAAVGIVYAVKQPGLEAVHGSHQIAKGLSSYDLSELSWMASCLIYPS